MKKVILALAVVSFAFAACNNDGEAKTENKDTAAATTPAVTPAPADTASKAPVDTAKKAPADTTKK